MDAGEAIANYEKYLRACNGKTLVQYWTDTGKQLRFIRKDKHGKPPKPFCVVSTGAYDFSRIMKLRENKDTYIDFVLGLFQSSRDEKDLSGKYRLTNIFGEKDGDPVDVYPVWNNEY